MNPSDPIPSHIRTLLASTLEPSASDLKSLKEFARESTTFVDTHIKNLLGPLADQILELVSLQTGAVLLTKIISQYPELGEYLSQPLTTTKTLAMNSCLELFEKIKTSTPTSNQN